MSDPRRRTLLTMVVSVGLAGCLNETDDSSNSRDPSPTESPSSATATATADPSTPTPTPTENESDTTTPPEKATQTPTEGTDREIFSDYEMETVSVQTTGGEGLGSVRAAIADTPSLRQTGLSDTETLPENYGMLFVFDSVDDWTFIMPDMDFGIDIIYADATGEITTIHHAPKPGPDEDGSEQEYPGRGQYVLEVNKEWTTERGVERGDILDFQL
ncbi:DUF192 domain-containing protein [Halovenus rubra]|uniref:DUF192 domain-containing protein n=2 Tax=Halovenus rubra TaxID=869890 RepID=A0ABD5X4Y1_9EURY|nr:DUF192 domain-containing protein [Halovenus rubra]